MHNKRPFGATRFRCGFGRRKAYKMKDSEWKSIQKKATTTIRLALAPAIKYIMLSETTPTKKKLEGICASKLLNQPSELEDRLVDIEFGRRR